MRLRALGVVLLVLACGRSDLDRGSPSATTEPPAFISDAGTGDAGTGPARCFPSDPMLTLACPLEQFCNYAWGSGPTTVDCAPFPAACATTPDCSCLIQHPPAPKPGQFCAAHYCSKRDSGLLVLTCSPD